MKFCVSIDKVAVFGERPHGYWEGSTPDAVAAQIDFMAGV